MKTEYNQQLMTTNVTAVLQWLSVTIRFYAKSKTPGDKDWPTYDNQYASMINEMTQIWPQQCSLKITTASANWLHPLPVFQKHPITGCTQGLTKQMTDWKQPTTNELCQPRQVLRSHRKTGVPRVWFGLSTHHQLNQEQDTVTAEQ